MNKINNKNASIAIIGAGISGLTAARRLKKKGYDNITIFEKEAHAGGKCCTYYHDGRSYELGAGAFTKENKLIFNILDELDMEKSYTGSQCFVDSENNEVALIPAKQNMKTFIQLVTYIRILLKNSEIKRPGFLWKNKALFETYDEFCKNNNLEILSKTFQPQMISFGYGYYDTVPGMYYLKYISDIATILKRAISTTVRKKPTYYSVKDGFGTMARNLAEQFNVLYNEKINKITRDREIILETDSGKFVFDYLIIACPLDNCLNFIDFDDDEKKLISKIKYNLYCTYLYQVDNFRNGSAYIPENFPREKQGHIMCWYQRYSDSNVYTFYAMGNDRIRGEKLESNIEEDIKKLGGTIKKKFSSVEWKYFPHVSSEDAKDGFYEKLDDLQGKNNTLMVGEIYNFSLVERTIRYSEYIVKRFFN